MEAVSNRRRTQHIVPRRDVCDLKCSIIPGHGTEIRPVEVNLDKLGIAKTAREEKTRVRDAALAEAENQKMMKLYREHVLKEAPAPEGLVQIGGIMSAPKKKSEEKEVGSFGD